MNTKEQIPFYKHTIPFIMLQAFLAFMSISAFAQTTSDAPANVTETNVASWQDSLVKIPSRKHPIYKGFDLSLGGPQIVVKSNTAAINDLHVGFFGGSVGGVLANPVGKLKGSLGLYYCGDNSRYQFDAVAANLSVNIYVLRMKEVRYHTFEPYVFAGLSQLKTSLYGTYLSEPTSLNMSMSSAPYIASVKSSQLVIGTGVEFQLESDRRDFIHMYAEASYGSTFKSRVTSESIRGTGVSNALWITVGVSFGTFK